MVPSGFHFPKYQLVSFRFEIIEMINIRSFENDNVFWILELSHWFITYFIGIIFLNLTCMRFIQ